MFGIAQYQICSMPLNPDDPRDVQSADLMDQIINRHYMDPLFRGEYPPDVLRRFRRFLPNNFEHDLETMRVPGDFLGINYYLAQSYRYSIWSPLTRARAALTPGAVRNDLGWEVHPEGLYERLHRIDADYGHPVVYVTENGFPTIEESTESGTRSASLEDPHRIDYLDSHIQAVARARREGIPVKGYFVWSLMDNFEWTEGYRARFGLLRVDFSTQSRTWRGSAHWYKQRIRRGTPEAE
jgi:beta-glucosidase